MSAPNLHSQRLRCREDTVLTAGEKRLFGGFFREHGLSEDLLTYFESLVQLSTENERFMFLKILSQDELVGLAMFARVARSNLYHSLNSQLRQYSFLETLGKALASTSYFSMHSVASPGLPRSFLYTANSLEDSVNEAILSWLKARKDADTVLIIDAAEKSDVYAKNSFTCLPFSSDSWLDVGRYETVADYLSIHKRTRKNLAQLRRRKAVSVETFRGDVPQEIKEGMRECLRCSIQNSKGLLPIQDFFNKHIFETALFTSESCIHFVIRVDGKIAGFSSRLFCGESLVGIMGGYNREHSGNSPVYELMIVTTLEYCIRNDYKRLVYGIVDNHTKARMMDSFRQQAVYFYSGKSVPRFLVPRAYRFLSGYELHTIDQASKGERQRREDRDTSAAT